MRSSPFVSAVAVALSLARSASSLQVVGPITNLVVGNAIVNPDGVARNAIVANGQFPGPLITGQPFSQYKITVSVV
jgi:iron transport multicopper oxidase